MRSHEGDNDNERNKDDDKDDDDGKTGQTPCTYKKVAKAPRFVVLHRISSNFVRLRRAPSHLSTTKSHHYGAPLRGATEWHHYAAPLRRITTPHHYVASLRHVSTSHHDVVPLRRKT